MTAGETTLAVAPGTGRLARRPGALLFVPDYDAGGDVLIERFLDADQRRIADETVQSVLEQELKAPAFALVTWPIAPADPPMHITALGDTVVMTDLPSLPSLSGSGSSTWVEHRVPGPPADATVRAGSDGATETNLLQGVVPAGGFTLRFSAPSPADRNPEPEPIEPPTAEVSEPAPDQQHAGEQADPTRRMPSPAIHGSADGLAALRELSGSDQPDDRLEPAAPELGAPGDRGKMTRPQVPDQPDARDSGHESPAQQPTRLIDSGENDPSTSTPTRPGPPVFPGRSDAEDTLPRNAPIPSDSAPKPVGDRLTHARLCPGGHPNPGHVTACRTCGLAVDIDLAMVTVEQPIVAVAVLPDGELVQIDDSIVIGRNPNLGQARLGQGRLVPIQAPPSVSRTHVRLDVDGWVLTVTDCGSRSGAAIVPVGDDEPIPLTPWVPHEIAGGDTVFLGGPTAIRIDEIAS